MEATQRIEQGVGKGVLEFSSKDLGGEHFDVGTSPLVTEGVVEPVPYRIDYYRVRPIYVDAVRLRGRGNGGTHGR